MPIIWETIKVYVFGAVLLAAIAGTWLVQDWRWQSKETNYVKEQLAQFQKEAAKENNAATQFEKKKEATDDTFKKIDKALQANKSSTVCFDPKRLRVVNSALARKAPASSGPSGSVSGPDTTVGQ